MVGYVNVYTFASIFLAALTVLAATKQSQVKYDTKLSDVVFIVLSQPDPYHARRAGRGERHFTRQMQDWAQDDMPQIYLTHKHWPSQIGLWTMFPILNQWVDNFSGKKWLFICEEDTRIDVLNMEKVIQKYDPEKDWFVGHALHDKEPTIIHHFTNPSKLTFPDTAAGILLSDPLIRKKHYCFHDINKTAVNLVKAFFSSPKRGGLTRLASRWPDEGFRADFAIDPKHELASYILMDDVKLTDEKSFCTGSDKPDCATTFAQKFPDCGPLIDTDELFVAVKTCEKFHKDRVPVVKKTWALETDNLEFYSETSDPSIPTIDLGVPNTERGHCGKTMAILERATTESHIKDKKWLLVADDDTIININRLQKLLACYDANKPVALGERYGYMVSKGHGYDYITGGGGMIFSRPLVERLVDECKCPSNDSPDDMIIGMCLRRMDVPITHIPYIHQARPDDYSEGYLGRQIPVSFHKHWNCDPYDVYRLLKAYDDQPDVRPNVNTSSDKQQPDIREEL